mmetsp:Transcript_67600/g.155076  ORF Transcript_67600/g.155076 Transcript_67600/m.155076 type:complete len:518 (+) Transcript_67600:19-1572(+)
MEEAEDLGEIVGSLIFTEYGPGRAATVKVAYDVAFVTLKLDRGGSVTVRHETATLMSTLTKVLQSQAKVKVGFADSQLLDALEEATDGLCNPGYKDAGATNRLGLRVAEALRPGFMAVDCEEEGLSRRFAAVLLRCFAVLKNPRSGGRQAIVRSIAAWIESPRSSGSVKEVLAAGCSNCVADLATPAMEWFPLLASMVTRGPKALVRIVRGLLADVAMHDGGLVRDLPALQRLNMLLHGLSTQPLERRAEFRPVATLIAGELHKSETTIPLAVKALVSLCITWETEDAVALAQSLYKLCRGVQNNISLALMMMRRVSAHLHECPSPVVLRKASTVLLQTRQGPLTELRGSEDAAAIGRYARMISLRMVVYLADTFGWEEPDSLGVPLRHSLARLRADPDMDVRLAALEIFTCDEGKFQGGETKDVVVAEVQSEAARKAAALASRVSNLQAKMAGAMRNVKNLQSKTMEKVEEEEDVVDASSLDVESLTQVMQQIAQLSEATAALQQVAMGAPASSSS